MAGGTKPTTEVASATSTTAASPAETQRYNLAADLLCSAFNRFNEAKRHINSGKIEQGKIIRRNAIKNVISALEAQGIVELMFAFNRLNTASSDMPEELVEDEGIDPDSYSELDLSDLEDDLDDDEDDADEGTDEDEDEGADTDEPEDDDSTSSDEESEDADWDTEASLTDMPDRAKLAMANVLSISGQVSDRRLATELLNPKSAK